MDIFNAIIITRIEHQNRIKAHRSMPPFVLKPERRVWHRMRQLLAALRRKRPQIVTVLADAPIPDTSTQTQPQVSL